MLTDLIVSDLGVIEHAEVDLEGGSTALTGETGAGKTLVVAAVGLLLGDRADRSLIRAGAARARVEGRLVIPGEHPVRAVLEEHDLLEPQGAESSGRAGPDAEPSGRVRPDAEPIELVVSRVIESDAGTSKARLNGRIVTLAVLEEICGSLIEIAGQHAHQKIGEPRWQRWLLDRMSGPEAVETAGEVSALVERSSRLADRAEVLIEGARARAREIDVLKYEIEEITQADLRPGESEDLQAGIARLEHAETLASGLVAAAGVLTGEGGAEESLVASEAELSKLIGFDPTLEPVMKRLESARYEVADVATELKARIEDPDPGDLEASRERLAVIGKVLRKYGSSESEVLGYLDSARTKLAELQGQEDQASTIAREAERLKIEALTKAEHLSELRRAAIPAFQSAVAARLADLAMPDAVFEVFLEPQDLYAGGIERPVYGLSTNQGEPSKPLRKVASGGELARIALALHLIAHAESESQRGRCLIFDEVDAGVGGTAARSVGRCLAELARTSEAQVLVVTHLPQVAACTDHHLKVTKRDTDSGTRAEVARLTGDARVEEVSRMLAGMPESSTAQDHARELLEEALG